MPISPVRDIVKQLFMESGLRDVTFALKELLQQRSTRRDFVKAINRNHWSRTCLTGEVRSEPMEPQI